MMALCAMIQVYSFGDDEQSFMPFLEEEKGEKEAIVLIFSFVVFFSNHEPFCVNVVDDLKGPHSFNTINEVFRSIKVLVVFFSAFTISLDCSYQDTGGKALTEKT